MDKKTNEEDRKAGQEIYERTGSNEHNDYRITGKENKTETPRKDEKNSYQDYNGNEDDNNPARAER